MHGPEMGIIPLRDEIAYCMQGGTRDKSTRWWSYNPRVPQVNFLQVLASNATNNTNTHHGNQSGKGRGYNFLQQKRRNAHLSCAKELLSSWSRRQQQEAPISHKTCSNRYKWTTTGKRQLFASQPRSRKLKPLVSEFMDWFATCQTLPHCQLFG